MLTHKKKKKIMKKDKKTEHVGWLNFMAYQPLYVI